MKMLLLSIQVRKYKKKNKTNRDNYVYQDTKRFEWVNTVHVDDGLMGTNLSQP